MFSVVIPLFNKSNNIIDAVNSVLKQGGCVKEIVVVNDGSTDDSVEVLASIVDPRLKVLHQKNMGVSAARNRGVNESSSEYICFLDADDRWKDGYLSEIRFLIDRCEGGQVFAANWCAISNGKIKKFNNIVSNKKYCCKLDYLDEMARGRSPFFSSSVVVTKRAFNNIGGFTEGVQMGEDIEMWLKLYLKYKISYSYSVLVEYHLDGDDRLCNRINSDIELPHIAILKSIEKDSMSLWKRLSVKRAVSRAKNDLLRRHIHSLQAMPKLTMFFDFDLYWSLSSAIKSIVLGMMFLIKPGSL